MLANTTEFYRTATPSNSYLMRAKYSLSFSKSNVGFKIETIGYLFQSNRTTCAELTRRIPKTAAVYSFPLHRCRQGTSLHKTIVPDNRLLRRHCGQETARYGRTRPPSSASTGGVIRPTFTADIHS